MSLAAHRYAAKPSAKINVPNAQKIAREGAERLPLLDRLLLGEHQRHAARLADIRAVADRLRELDGIVRAATADGAYIAFDRVCQSISRYTSSGRDYSRGVHAVVLCPNDTLSGWRVAKAQNAVANALLAAGWRIAYASSHGSEISLDHVVFMHGRRAVETTCMRQWTLDAIEAGHITAETQGRHPATDTGAPLNTTRAAQSATASA